ncbi:MAG: MAPEG family protein [Myxococcota bacterium]
MKTALICLFISLLLPYVWGVFLARGRIKMAGHLDNKHPRTHDSALTGLGARALGAHQNSFEALILFAPTVILAAITGADSTWVARLSIAFVAARVVHGIAYLSNQDKLRSGMFAVALLSVIGIWVQIFGTF